MSSKAYIEYEIIETKEVKMLYRHVSPSLFNDVMKIINHCELPYIMRGGEIKILEVGVIDD